jgi:hypothetical protein
MPAIRLIAGVVLLAAAGSGLSGQSVLVYSEFQRVRPDGHVVEQDRTERRREIISPAVARNSHATFRLAVEAVPGVPYAIHIGQNPDKTVEAALFQEEYTQVGEQWIPDKVRRVLLPHGAVLGADQKVQTYLLDLWVPATAQPGRFRLEVQFNAGQEWIIYPMEIRVQEISVPGQAEARGALPGLEARADAAVNGPLLEYDCGAPPQTALLPLETGRAITIRNVRQDLQLAKLREKTAPPEMVAAHLTLAAGWTTRGEFCVSRLPAPNGPEWWLRARDYLYQAAAGR